MAFIISARRSPIIPKNGAFNSLEFEKIASPVIKAVLNDAQVISEDLDYVIIGNALGAGGNPARLCSLEAEIPETCPAITIDSQCCSGLDAVGLAAAKIKSGDADLILAGGVESYSKAPLRAKIDQKKNIKPYDFAKFSPWQNEESNFIENILSNPYISKVPKSEQFKLAIESHQKALKWDHPDIVPVKVNDKIVINDHFTRNLNLQTCLRIENYEKKKINPCLIANSADGAGMVVVASKKYLKKKRSLEFFLKINNHYQFGYCALNPTSIPQKFLAHSFYNVRQFNQIEWMESFAGQFIKNKETFDLPDSTTNPYGGMIAMGHPVAATGAILISRLFHGLKNTNKTKRFLNGLALIPSAGGLVSAIYLSGINL